MSTVTTDAKIIELLERISKAESYKGGAWNRVIVEAKKYAMMKSFGKYLETDSNDNEHFVVVSFGERERYTQMFAENVLRFSVDAVAESAIGF